MLPIIGDNPRRFEGKLLASSGNIFHSFSLYAASTANSLGVKPVLPYDKDCVFSALFPWYRNSFY